jgi:hypothetical protein
MKIEGSVALQASTFTDAPSLDAARLELETDYFGTRRMCRAFARRFSPPTSAGRQLLP